MTTKDEDSIFHIRYAQTHDNLLFFTDKGKAYQLRAFEISESSRTSKGSAVVNLLNIEANEKVQSFITYRKDEKGGYVFLTTRKGTVKKSKLSDFENIRKTGILAIKLDKGDELVWSKLTQGDNDVLLATKHGKAIRFSEKSVRPMGRNTRGVRGIKVGEGDLVIGMDILDAKEDCYLLTIMQNGLGKKTAAKLFRGQQRGGQGVKVAKVTKKTGEVVFAQVIPNQCNEAIITSKKGQIVKLEIDSIPKLSRDTQGVILMRFSDANDHVASATCIENED
jgi:DNA gyrase subunit A